MLIFTRTIGNRSNKNTRWINADNCSGSIYYLYSCNSSYLVLSLRPHEVGYHMCQANHLLTLVGFDVSNYILHSPGSLQLETYDAITITPDRYKAERLTKISLRVITFVLAFSRYVNIASYAGYAIH